MSLLPLSTGPHPEGVLKAQWVGVMPLPPSLRHTPQSPFSQSNAHNWSDLMDWCNVLSFNSHYHDWCGAAGPHWIPQSAARTLWLHVTSQRTVLACSRATRDRVWQLLQPAPSSGGSPGNSYSSQRHLVADGLLSQGSYTCSKRETFR